MIDNRYLRTMARYNRWQNQELYSAAETLSEDARQKERAAFWSSIHGTLSHIYWADRIWLSRFNLVEPPEVSIGGSSTLVVFWTDLVAKRKTLDDLLVEWSDGYEEGPVKGALEWFSGSTGKEEKAPLSVVLTHFFNHQTHHRGQVHAMLTAAGAKTADTDLFLMPIEHWPV